MLKLNGIFFITLDGDNSTLPSTAKDINQEDEMVPCDKKKSQSRLLLNVAVNIPVDFLSTLMMVMEISMVVAFHQTVMENPTIPIDWIAANTDPSKPLAHAKNKFINQKIHQSERK